MTQSSIKNIVRSLTITSVRPPKNSGTVSIECESLTGVERRENSVFEKSNQWKRMNMTRRVMKNVKSGWIFHGAGLSSPLGVYSPLSHVVISVSEGWRHPGDVKWVQMGVKTITRHECSQPIRSRYLSHQKQSRHAIGASDIWCN